MQACLRQQLLRVGPLPQLVDQHDRVDDAASLGGEHPLHNGLGATAAAPQARGAGSTARDSM